MNTPTTFDRVYDAVLTCEADRTDCSATGIFDAYVKAGGKPKAFGEVFLALQRMGREGRLRYEILPFKDSVAWLWFTAKAARMPDSVMKQAA